MKIEELKRLPKAEVESLEEAQRARTIEAESEYRKELALSQALSIAVSCHRLGIWLGEKVQLTGRHGGKDNPLAILEGFYPASGSPWPIVRLLNKDGSPAHNTLQLYGKDKLTKVDA